MIKGEIWFSGDLGLRKKKGRTARRPKIRAAASEWK